MKNLTYFFKLIANWHSKHRQRRGLGELAPEILVDIGISRCQARAEARKPFWK